MSFQRELPEVLRHRRVLWSHQVRVPTEDWAAVKAGTKTEMRSMNVTHFKKPTYKTPTVVLVYSVNLARTWDWALKILEKTWTEQLMSITPESIEREGYSSMDEFRRYWSLRNTKSHRFPALAEVRVYRFAPWDEALAGRYALEALYGDFL